MNNQESEKSKQYSQLHDSALKSAVHRLYSEGNIKEVEFILSIPNCNLDAQFILDALFRPAFEDGHLSLIKCIVEKEKVPIEVINNSFEYIVTQTVSYGHTDIADYLLNLPNIEKLETPYAFSTNLMKQCSLTQNINTTRYFFNFLESKNWINIQHQGDMIFRYACLYGDFEFIKFLVNEKNIEKTESICSTLDFYEKEPNIDKMDKNFTYKVRDLFEKRELKQNLEKELVFDKINKKKLKL